ncbi:hypothetical protein RYZ26_08385 [Terasakiella sp. A23]|uniref:hypothetical protein n=1 Tax=Terasakiella sp. FCG-A23 TaxID=3080561 RepID=UPI0029544A8C|nr:hypothetical protein [Terasakiella sp. A23]MDV7339606.1 hypothetical protein [Terasakiella sp. A23]
MKTGLSAMALGVAMMFGAISANAADLINEDEIPYAILVDGEMELTVEAGSDLMAFCKRCTVQLVDSFEPPVSADEDSTVIISQGRLVVEK